VAKRHGTGEKLCDFELKTPMLLDEAQAGGRINLIIGRGLTARTRESLGLAPSDAFRVPVNPPGRGILRTSTPSTLMNRRPESARLYEHCPLRQVSKS